MCEALSSIKLGSGLKQIGAYAFYGTAAMANATESSPIVLPTEAVIAVINAEWELGIPPELIILPKSNLFSSTNTSTTLITCAINHARMAAIKALFSNKSTNSTLPRPSHAS